MNKIILNNGIEMPLLGLGTFLIPETELSKTIKDAYELGYRQFDTAWKYHNEHAISCALKDNGIKREDVFLTTKVTAASLYKGQYKYGKKGILNIPNGRTIKEVIQESFDNLGTEYIDLFLIHYPYPNSDRLWRELERLYLSGRIRAIGVSNFLKPHLEALSQITDIVPAVNQFEISPLNTQKELIKYCQNKGIAVQAMSTFSHFRSIKPREEIIKDAKLMAIGSKYNKSVVQIVLRWLLQQNIIMIPKTWYTPHLKENIDIFDFELTKEEMSVIDSLDRGVFLNYNPYGQQQGFFRRVRNCEEFKIWNETHSTNFIADIIDQIRYKLSI